MHTTNDTPQLLRAYVDQGSEAAFQELVSRYVDLVYSVALRRGNGNTHFAEDVVQAVFTDLARKAASLPGNIMLGGWLHRHTGFVANNLLRSEHRRITREQEAVAMNLPTTDSDWHQIAPLLDEAIDELDATDRDAILLRYFEQRDLRSVGLALGVTEDTAQKRVSRAVDKLRGLLTSRGATLSAITLGTALTTQAVTAAPAHLASKVSKTALAGKAVGLGLVAWLLHWISTTNAKLAVGLALGAVVAVTLLRPTETANPTKPAPSALKAKASAAIPAPTNAPKSTTTPAAAMATVAAPASTNVAALRLSITSAVSGKALRSVQVKMRAYIDGKFTTKTFRANKDGHYDIQFASEKTTSLQLITELDGYADTKLQWQTDRGEVIPATYSLKLIRATPIGGTVVDADGQPVAGAKIGFNHEDDMASKGLTENHEFGYIQVATDSEGRWSINRIASEMIRRLRGGAQHPDHLDTLGYAVSRHPEMEQQFREATHVYHLGRPIEIHGVVVDAGGNPVPEATVLVGGRSMSDRREGKSAADGTFLIKGCKPGKNLLSADAKGWSTATLEVEATTNSAPFRLVMQRGKILRLRIVNRAGAPIPGATAGLNTNPYRPIQPMNPRPEPVASQARFSGKSDAEGRVEWKSAPDAELDLYFWAKGHMTLRDFKVRPDDQEHVVTLAPALTISGTVSDAESGASIPKFQIISGHPRVSFKVPSAGAPYTGKPQTVTNAQWSTLERFWLNFANGTYRHSFEEPVVGGGPNPGYYLKFEAEGYSAYGSRLIQADEGEVRIDVALHPARPVLVTISQPDSAPAASADIGLVAPGASLSLAPGGLSRKNPQSGGSIKVADAKGQLRLLPDYTVTRIIITHPSGFAETTLSELSKEPSIRLQPWGHIEGVYLSGGQPAPDREIKFEYGRSEPEAISSDFSDCRTVTDAQGRFAFRKVPAGKHQIIRLIPSKLNALSGVSGSKSWTSEPLVDIEVRPGETNSVTLGATGYRVSLRLLGPEGLQPATNHHVSVMLSTPAPESMQALRGNPSALREWQKSPEYQAWIASRKLFSFAENPDGTFTGEGIPAGTFTLGVSITERQPKLIRQLATGSFSVTVPAEPTNGSLDLGELQLQSSRTP